MPMRGGENWLPSVGCGHGAVIQGWDVHAIPQACLGSTGVLCQVE